jgi:CRISPR-associated protein Cmr3
VSTVANAQSARTWWLEPRDPLVFGDGSRVPALAPRHRYLLPPQGTLAGMVRTRFVTGQAAVSKSDAASLLEIRVRGPWLARRREAGSPLELWLPVPVDVVETGGAYLPGELLGLGPEEGSLWPAGVPVLPELVGRVDRKGGTKTSAPPFPFWPLEQVVRWSLRPGSGGEVQSGPRRPVSREYRVHVGIEDKTWTAEPEALFSSAGVRYDTGFGIAVEVTDGRREPGPDSPAPETPPHLVILGAEARTTSCTVLPGLCFPDFEGPVASWRSEEENPRPPSFCDLYRERIMEIQAEGRRVGLRLQLLTPGAFGGWEPRWPPELRDRLLAVSMERHVAVSGWDLQKGGPRGVRRLVPAGSLYFLDPLGGSGAGDTAEAILDLCARWWGRSLCEGGEGDEESFLAPPHHDGYGFVLPAPFGIPGRTS